jgi:hypothetical protein
MKKIIYSLLGLIIAIFLTIIFATDILAKKYIESQASELLDTKVTVDDFSANFLGKNASIKSITVKNPPNFNNENAFTLDNFYLELGDIKSDIIVINEVRFEDIKFILEQGSSGFNLNNLIDNIETEKESNEETKSREKNIKIKKFVINNIKLKIDTKLLKTTIKVPDISLTDFGGDDGIKSSEIGYEIVKTLFSNIKTALNKSTALKGKNKIKESINKIKKSIDVDKVKQEIDVDKIKEKGKNLLEKLGI